MQRLKILYYNWADFEDKGHGGGGVSTYQQNLVDAATRRGDRVWFLSSGVSYRPFSSRPFLNPVAAQKEGVRKYELVNSTILSPGQTAFGQDVASAPEMEAVFADFLREHGPFDVVHFNNLEGIPVSFLRLAREHSARARIVYSVHNYFAFCPQVNLWFQERALCKDFRDGRKCANCLVKPINSRGTRRFYQLDHCLSKLGIRAPGALHRAVSWFVHYPLRLSFRGLLAAVRAAVALPGRALGRRPAPVEPRRIPLIVNDDVAARFADRRRTFVEAINAHVDCVLAVSRRVAELVRGFGIAPHKVQTSYIGTRFAGRAQTSCAEASLLPPTTGAVTRFAGLEGPPRRRILRIAYLGYVRRDKGFYFFLRALEKMPAGLARHLEVVFAAKVTDEHAYERVKRMAHRFAAVSFHDGYTHADLPALLSRVDLGVVPVLWEDNLPQVAIECVGSGVPILTSDRGGARELLDCPDLVFRAGSRADLYARLRAVLRDPSILRLALTGQTRLYTPDEHYDQLRESAYQGHAAAGPEPALAAGPAACSTSP